MDDEYVLDRVTAALVKRPCTLAELLYQGGEEDEIPRIGQIETALDILDSANALVFMKKGNVYALRSESRLYKVCAVCKGQGVQADQKRGLCPFCHGNGVYTPVPGHI
jgi:hypothetical protein